MTPTSDSSAGRNQNDRVQLRASEKRPSQQSSAPAEPPLRRNRQAAVRAAVIGLLTIHTALLAHAATQHGPTTLEPAFLVAGLSHWEFGRFELFRVNPPLVRMVAALPVTIAGYQMDWSNFFDSPSGRPEYSMGSDFVKANGPRSIWLFTLARWACIPFSLMGGLFCFCWSRELWNSSLAGLIALTLWCFDPNLLAHAELITTDCAATSFGLGAGYYFWRWLKRPAWGRAAAAGVLLGLAELSKTTWIFLFLLWPLLWVYWLTSARWRAKTNAQPGLTRKNLKSQMCQLAVILMLALYLLNLNYGFDGTFTRLKDYSFASTTFTGSEDSDKGDNRFTRSWVAELPLPVPREYLRGIDLQLQDFEDFGQPSYLRGEWKMGGWWYYYLYGLMVKIPHGSQVMFLLSALTVVFAKHRVGLDQRSAMLSDLIILLSPALAVLVLVSAQLEFNHHFRYVLPALGYLFVFSGVTAGWFLSGSKS